jgi:hypothetical protein
MDTAAYDTNDGHLHLEMPPNSAKWLM